MSPQQQERQAKIPAGRGRVGPARSGSRVAWKRAEERGEWGQLQRRRGKALGDLEKREQAGVVGALRASPAAAGILGKRLPRGAGALQAMAGAGRQSARDRRGDPGTNGSAGTLPGGVGGAGYAGSGFRWEKSIPKRCGGSRARRENFTARAWKGRRNGRGNGSVGRRRDFGPSR